VAFNFQYIFTAPKPEHRPTMKASFAAKSSNQNTLSVDRKNPPLRAGTKTGAHRYERRKLREQLRHLDWALVGED